MFINIHISSKNFSSIKNFINFLNTVSLSKSLKNKFFLKYFKIPASKKVFTLLKSPHVNKTAQDQFEFIIFSNKISLYSFKTSKFLYLLKKINLNLFPDVKIKLSFFFNFKKFKEKKIKVFELNKFSLKMLSSKLYFNHKMKIYLRLLDVYGEINL
jgi:ribosomal protein S10